MPTRQRTIGLGLRDRVRRLALPALLSRSGPHKRTPQEGRWPGQGAPAPGTHLPLLLQAAAHPLEVGSPPVAPVPAAALPAVPLRLLQGPAASPGVVQEVPHRVGLQHAFLRAQGVGDGVGGLMGGRGVAEGRAAGTPGALTRWLRSYSAIFSISSFIFSMFCRRRSSHS